MNALKLPLAVFALSLAAIAIAVETLSRVRQ
jgi:hypothetical protein